MGLTIGSLKLILEEHKRRPITGRVLTLGRQLVHVSYSQALDLFGIVGTEVHDHNPVSAPQSTTKPIEPELFFQMMGLEEMLVLDIPSGWNADIVADLNFPVPSEYHNSFGAVIDAGTLEHVFDVRSGFQNVASLAAPGGRILHVSPMNNYVNHGFIQLSPTIFFDYYERNAFADLYGKIIVHSRKGWGVHDTWSIFPYIRNTMGGLNSLLAADDNTMLSMFFVATKTERSTVDAVPTQSFFRLTEAEQSMPTASFSFVYDPSGAKVTRL